MLSTKELSNLKSSKVADYFFSVSAGNELVILNNSSTPSNPSSIEDIAFEFLVIDRYPVITKSTSNTTPFPEGVHLFCLPGGLSLHNTHKRPTFHSFVHTSENGTRLLGSCLTFYEPLNEFQLNSLQTILQQGGYDDMTADASSVQWWLPKCICLISQWPFAYAFKQVLCQLYLMSFESHAIPLERYICNFIDDVPAPPVGRVDITYYLGSFGISFRCPPLNQPHAWSGLPLNPLFECLSVPNILLLFVAIVAERQIVYISSQYSLLTYCIEAMTSLIYPLKWSHVYIPILPVSLLGVLGAPVPFQVGVHSSFIIKSDPEELPPTVQDYENTRLLRENENMLRVYLDHNHIEFGDEGPPPPLPDARGGKLLESLMASKAAAVFESRNADVIGSDIDWAKHKLPHYDDAYLFDTPIRAAFLKLDDRDSAQADTYGVVDSVSALKTDSIGIFKSHSSISRHHNSFTSIETASVDEQQLRHGFLGFFVAILKNYRRFLVYASRERPSPLAAFRNEAFIAEHPVDWHPFLIALVQSQAFSQFVDERVGRIQTGENRGAMMNDIVFFDESIDAKMNRYYFSLSTIDTPFLKSTADNHAKTYVPPSPDSNGLEDLINGSITYNRFPLLDPVFFAPLRAGNVNSAFEASTRGQALAAAASQARLKRTNAVPATENLSLASCHWSCILTVLSHLIVTSSTQAKGIQRASCHDIQLEIAFHGSPFKPASSRDRSNSQESFTRSRKPTIVSEPVCAEDEAALAAAAKLALKVTLECLNCLTKMNDSPDEISFRYLVDACSKCGESCSAVEIIALLCAFGFQPDTALISAVALAVAKDKADNHVDPDDIWTTKDWRALYLKLQKIKINAVPVTVPNGKGVANKSLSLGDDVSALPKLLWTGFSDIDRSTVYAASPRLVRHMLIAEQLLGQLYPDLDIDLNHPFGTCCPNPKCCKPQSITHVMSGFSRDANIYTTKCYSCDRSYVPRFTVQCSLPDWEGSEKQGPGSILWCEFLSPWVLRKEVFSVLFVDGVDALISKQALANVSRETNHNAIVFWNIIVVCRLRGLPYSFLLTSSLEDAFPDKKPKATESTSNN